MELLAEQLRKLIDVMSQLAIFSSVAAGPCILSVTKKSSELMCNPRLANAA